MQTLFIAQIVFIFNLR